LTFGSQLLTRGVSGGGVEKRRIDLVSDVSFQAPNDVAVGQTFRSATIKIGHGARLAVSSVE
jgi:hypothetical protein